MIDKKQRIELRSKAQALKPVVLVGIDGFTENVIKQIDEELFNHELIKVGMQENAPTPTEFELTELAVKLSADLVTIIGRKIVLYRHTEKKGVVHALDEENLNNKTISHKKITTGKHVNRTYKQKRTEAREKEKFNDEINRTNSANYKNSKKSTYNKTNTNNKNFKTSKSKNFKTSARRPNKTKTNKTNKKSVY